MNGPKAVMHGKMHLQCQYCPKRFSMKHNLEHHIKGPSMSIPKSFTAQIYWSDLPVLFMFVTILVKIDKTSQIYQHFLWLEKKIYKESTFNHEKYS